jgi:hypothetical protein
MGQILIVPLAFAICLFILLGWHFERPTGQQSRARASAPVQSESRSTTIRSQKR